MIRKVLMASALALLVVACDASNEIRNEAGISFTVAKNLSETTMEGRAQLHCNDYGRDAYPAGSTAIKGSDKKAIHFRCLPPTYPLRDPDGTVTILFSQTRSSEATADKRAEAVCGEDDLKAVRKGKVGIYKGPIKPFIGWSEAQYNCAS